MSRSQVAPARRRVHGSGSSFRQHMPVTRTSRTVRIGLAGLGNVGLGVFKNLQKSGGLLRERTGFDLQVTRVAVRDPAKPRDAVLPPGVICSDWREVVADKSVEIVTELIGGTTEAFELVCAALRAKKPVVTGNKALLAERGARLA